MRPRIPYFSPLPRVFAVALAIALPITLVSQEASSPRKWTVDDVLAVKGVGGVAVSPDGKRVAYVVTTSDRESNINRSDIFIVATDGGKPIQITHGTRSDRAPQWAGDGSWIAFLSDRADKKTMQVWGIDPAGGEAWQITKHETSIGSFALSPNGERIAFLATAPVDKADSALEKQRGRPIVRDSAYANEYVRLWTANLVNREAGGEKTSSPDGVSVTSVVWGPDSRGIAWVGQPTPTIRAAENDEVYVQAEPEADVRRLNRLPGQLTVAAWPNDPGLIIRATGKRYTTDNDRLWLAPLNGDDPVSLSDAFDESASLVGADAKQLLIQADVRTDGALFRLPLASGKPAGAPQRVSDGGRYYSGCAVAKNGTVVACVGESATEAPDVYASSVASFSPRRLTNVNPETTAFGYGERRVITWKSEADSETIEGVLTLPVGYQPGARVPLLLVIHGGPGGVSSNRYPSMRGAYPVSVFNSLGYAVLQPNYRGSTGYGQRFRGLNHGDVPGKDWVDVNSGIDMLVHTGVVDSAKVGIMGWSYGGFQTYWGITHSPRFAAASAGAGANDLPAFWSQTDISEYMTTLEGVAPWDNFDLYLQHSAIRLAKNVTAPTLIQVGAADKRVPPEQSIEFYEALKGIGKVPTKLVEYPGQPHGINDPRLTRDLMNRNVQWFTFWVPVTGQKPPIRVDNNQ